MVRGTHPTLAAGMETNRPVMTTEHSREYYETHDAETILRILKYIVSR